MPNYVKLKKTFFVKIERQLSRHTILLRLKTGTLQNNERYQINVVYILLGVCVYLGFL